MYYDLYESYYNISYLKTTPIEYKRLLLNNKQCIKIKYTSFIVWALITTEVLFKNNHRYQSGVIKYVFLSLINIDSQIVTYYIKN